MTVGERTGVRFARARESDLDSILALLESAALPAGGARDAFRTGLVAWSGERMAGCAAIEPYGNAGLLRSVAIVPERRGSGNGRELVGAAERLAATLGIGELYLLTESAASWFARLGYESIDRAEVPEPVRSSVEFRSACPETAVAMRRLLRAANAEQ